VWLVVLVGPAMASTSGEPNPIWVHDHSSAGIPYRPDGYADLVRKFGRPCSNAANDARSYWPNQSARGVAGYVYYHTYISRAGGDVPNAGDGVEGEPNLGGGPGARTPGGRGGWSGGDRRRRRRPALRALRRPPRRRRPSRRRPARVRHRLRPGPSGHRRRGDR